MLSWVLPRAMSDLGDQVMRRVHLAHSGGMEVLIRIRNRDETEKFCGWITDLLIPAKRMSSREERKSSSESTGIIKRLINEGPNHSNNEWMIRNDVNWHLRRVWKSEWPAANHLTDQAPLCTKSEFPTVPEGVKGAVGARRRGRRRQRWRRRSRGIKREN